MLGLVLGLGLGLGLGLVPASRDAGAAGGERIAASCVVPDTWLGLGLGLGLGLELGLALGLGLA